MRTSPDSEAVSLRSIASSRSPTVAAGSRAVPPSGASAQIDSVPAASPESVKRPERSVSARASGMTSPRRWAMRSSNCSACRSHSVESSETPQPSQSQPSSERVSPGSMPVAVTIAPATGVPSRSTWPEIMPLPFGAARACVSTALAGPAFTIGGLVSGGAVDGERTHHHPARAARATMVSPAVSHLRTQRRRLPHEAERRSLSFNETRLLPFHSSMLALYARSIGPSVSPMRPAS